MEQETSAEAMWNEELATRESAAGPEATPTPAPVSTQKAAAPEAKPETVEPPKPTTEELLTQAIAKIDKLEGRTRNVEGHIGNLNGQQKTIQEQLAASQLAAREVKDAPTQAQVKAAPIGTPEWESLKSDFPEWADATEKFMDAKLANLQAGVDVATVEAKVAEALSKVTGTLTKEIEKRIVDTTLNAQFPGWKNEVNTEPFVKWLQSQNAEIKRLADSDDVGDAATMLSLYKEAKRSNPAQKILDKRQQTLQAAVAAPRGTRPAPTKSVADMTPQELWDYEARQRERSRAIQ